LLPTSFVIGIFAAVSVSRARGADADIEALKTEFQAEFKRLEKRINNLETENAQLRREAGAAKPAKVSPEIASLKKRVTELEVTADRSSPMNEPTAKRADANAEAVKAIEMKLQADATETRDIYRDDGGWPF